MRPSPPLKGKVRRVPAVIAMLAAHENFNNATNEKFSLFPFFLFFFAPSTAFETETLARSLLLLSALLTGRTYRCLGAA